MDKRDFYNELRMSLSDKEVINILNKLGATNYIDKKDYIIFPTICHNKSQEEASFKLYYYKSNKLFHCYTECGDSFDIFHLIERVFETRGIPYSFSTDVLSFFNLSNVKINNFEKEKYISEIEKYQTQEKIKLFNYPKTILSSFISYHAVEWLQEGITDKSMDKFNILYSITQNKIIIPHYDKDSNLIGIRARALNPEDIEKGKYMPVTINDTIYSHPLSLNLYGLNINKNNIQKLHYVVVFEGEKSVLLMDSYFPNSTAVATCGSNFHKHQLDLLLQYDISEIIIAFDKENTNNNNSEKYFNKLYNICNKYSKYCRFSFIYDRTGLLNDKDSPIDEGKEVFLRLLESRVTL